MSRSLPQCIKDQKQDFCAACGTEDDLQYHHLIPAVRGGTDDPTNIIVLCAECHAKIHGRGTCVHNRLVKEGIAKAKEKGVHVGRKPANREAIFRAIAEYSTQFNEIGSYGYTPMTENEIMDMLGIKSVCYRKYKRKLFEAMEAEVWPYDWPKPVQVRHYPLYDHVVKQLRENL
jgi:hypothetical protein